MGHQIKKKCFQESGGKRTFHKTGDQLKVQGPDLFQINYRSTSIRTLLKVNHFMSSISTFIKKLTLNVLMELRHEMVIQKNFSSILLNEIIHKSNSCFPWNRNNVIRAISNNYCEVGCNSFADFPLLSRYSDVHQISWPLFLKALACLHSSPLGRTVVLQFVLPDFFLHKIIIFSCNFNWPQVTTFC